MRGEVLLLLLFSSEVPAKNYSTGGPHMSISFHCFDFDTITEVAPAAAALTTLRYYCL